MVVEVEVGCWCLELLLMMLMMMLVVVLALLTPGISLLESVNTYIPRPRGG